MTVDPPLAVRVQFAHAVVQHVAQEAGIRLLHLKGPTMSPELIAGRSPSTDADVWAQPGQAQRLIKALRDAGWVKVTSFRSGSAFKHAATLHHSLFGYTDIHRFFPGLQAPDAFDRLYDRRVTRSLAGIDCACLDPVAERLVLVVHAARSQSRSSDLDLAWHKQPEGVRAEIIQLANEVEAQVALAAALGNLADYEGAKSYRMWRTYTSPSTRLERLRARIELAPDWKARAGELVAGWQPNTRYEEIRSGRPLGQMGRVRFTLQHYLRLARMLGGAVKNRARRIMR
ncbi:MAG: nucleotidyltransferase family protein [Propionibacteriaceae bacterium]|nr:nucleotidyltransferase family protein [Propionibacteriaceae bacterium]